MSPNASPDRETLLLWISAFFDGELTVAEEQQLFAAMAEDPALEAEFLLMERSLGATAELSGLADAVMAQVAPEAVSDAAPLLSAYMDDEADDAQRARLLSLTAAGPAADALSFLHAAEGVGLVLEGVPESAAVKAALAPLPAAVSARVLQDERAAELLSALADDDVTAAERDELLGLVSAGAAPELSFLHLSEALSFAVRAPAADPAAARAGAAALQALAAEEHQRASAARPAAASVSSPSFLERVRAGFGGLFAPLAAAACAAAIFVSLQGGPGVGGAGADDGAVPTVTPPEDWARTFLPTLEEDLLAAATAEDLEVLGDNGGTEVQAIDSGSQVAAVFSTEASSITVIWVPEPTESGT